MNRLERLLDLVHVLQTARGPVPLSRLRQQFPDYADGSEDATRRKFERDKAELAAIGLVLRYIEDDGFSDAGYLLDVDASYLPPLELGPSERATLASASRAALASADFPHRRALRMALAKLDADNPAEERSGPAIGFSHGSVDESGADRVEALGEALTNRKRVTLTYRKPGADAVTRDVDPYSVFMKAGAWYVAGYDHRSETVRIFRVSRIEDAVVNSKKPTQPDFDVPDEFDVRALTRMDPLRFEVHAPVECRVRVDPEVTFMMRGAWGEPDEDGVFTIVTTHLRYLVEQVLGLGRRAELLSPPEGRDAMAEALRAVLVAHGEATR